MGKRQFPKKIWMIPKKEKRKKETIEGWRRRRGRKQGRRASKLLSQLARSKLVN